MLGCSDFTVQVQPRGGGSVLFEVPWQAISMARVLNNAGDFSVGIPRTGNFRPCEEILRTVEPYRHELIVYGDAEVCAVGPVTNLRAESDIVTISGHGLYHWFERRFYSEDFFAAGDLADVFKAAAETAILLEPSINLDVISRHVEIDGARSFRGADFPRVADVLGELSRTGLDFVQVNRQLLAGQLSDLLRSPVILTDDVCLEVSIERDGANFATDIAVFGQVPLDQAVPVSGRVSRMGTVYGLVQESISEGLLVDADSAWLNAMTRLQAMQPAPMTVSAVLTSQAPVQLAELYPGMIADMRLYETGLVIDQEMLISTVDISISASDAGNSQRVAINLIPKGPELAQIAGIRGTTDL